MKTKKRKVRTKWCLTTKNGQEKSNIRVDIDFSEETGINVNATNLKLCLDFFYLLLHKRYGTC